MGRRKADREGLASQLASLPSLSSDELKALWTSFYGNPPPAKIGRGLLTYGVAYKLQEKVLGGLEASAARQLARIADDLAAGKKPRHPDRKIKPGTRLWREWQGSSHEVIVLDKGVSYRGRTYRSLSAVAEAITGNHWSGPLFFGLKSAAARDAA